MKPPVTDDELNEYLDGGLSEARRAEVEAWLLEKPERVAEFERMKELNEALQRLGADILEEPVPERLRDIVRQRGSSDHGASGGTGAKKGQALGLAMLLLIGAAFDPAAGDGPADATTSGILAAGDGDYGATSRSLARR